MPIVGEAQENFRQRLLGGLAEAIREQGFTRTRVADIVRNAGTSRRTFYEHFTSREDCLIELIREANTTMIAAIAQAVDPEANWEVQVDQAITAWIEAAASEPALMLSWVRDVPSLGDRARQLERETMEDFVSLVGMILAEESMQTAGHGSPPLEWIILLLGGLRELLARTFDEGRDPLSIRNVAVDATKALAMASREGVRGHA